MNSCLTSATWLHGRSESSLSCMMMTSGPPHANTVLLCHDTVRRLSPDALWTAVLGLPSLQNQTLINLCFLNYPVPDVLLQQQKMMSMNV